MGKRILAVLLCLSLTAGLWLPAYAVEVAKTGTKIPEEIEALETFAGEQKALEETETEEAPEETGILGIPADLEQPEGLDSVEEIPPATSAAAQDDSLVSYAVEGGNIYFDPTTGTIKDCDREVTKADIPSSIGGVAVTSIGPEVFWHCSGLTSVTIPDSVTSIGYSAFSGCSGLTSITVPDSVTSIGNHAFVDCSGLTSITIPNGVTSIEFFAFSGCSGLTSITIPDGTTSIENNSFEGCSGLTSITIPNSVTSIGSSSFKGCSELTSITIPDGVASIEHGVFEDCSRLTSITIPDSVTSIKSWAFKGCSALTSITIPNSVTSIGERVFEYCRGLTSITIPDGITSISFRVFAGCSALTSITIPDSVTNIGDSVFYGCSELTSITIPDGVTSIGSEVFRECSALTSITIPDGVTKIGSFVFSGCSALTSITVPDIVTRIEDWAFYGCSELTSITIPDGITSIGHEAFRGCSGLTSITIPDGVTSIGYSAFLDCSALTSITVPDSVTSIEWGAFKGCSELTSITIPDGVTGIGQSMFYGCSAMTSITVPDSVTSIGEEAFCGCSALTSITIPDGVTSIENWAFNGCSALAGITIPDSVTSIGKYAFIGCSGLTSITIPDSVTSIESWAFKGCSAMTSITIPNSVTSIGYSAFSGCSRLESITIPDGVTSVEGSVFSSCSGLTNITIPDSVTSIGGSAFKGCNGLTSITIPDSVTSIGSGAFDGCSKLTDIHYSSSESQWEKIDIKDGNDPLTISATIHYNSTGPDDIPDSSRIRLDTKLDVRVDELHHIYGHICGISGISKEDCIWTIDHENVVTIESTGYIPFPGIDEAMISASVRCISTGSATITLTLPDGQSASCVINVDRKAGTLQLSGNNDLLVGETTELRGEYMVYGVSSEEGPIVWKTNNPTVVAFDETGTREVSYKLEKFPATDTMTVYARRSGTARVSMTLPEGTVKSLTIKVQTPEERACQKLIGDLRIAYATYLNAVRDALGNSREVTVSDATIEQQAQALMKADGSNKGKHLVSLNPSIDDTVKENVYLAVAKFMAEYVAEEVSFSEVSATDLNKAAIEIVNNVLKSIDKKTYKYSFGSATVKLGGTGLWGTQFRSITYQDSKDPRYKKATSVGMLVSNPDEAIAVVTKFLQELEELLKKSVNTVSNSLYTSLTKLVIGKDIDDLIKGNVAKKIEEKFTKHADFFKNHVGIGKFLADFNEFINYYQYGVIPIINFITSSSDEKDLSWMSQTLDSMSKIKFEDDTITDNATELAMQGINAAKKTFEKSMKEYIRTGTISEGKFSDWWSELTSGFKSTFKCPVTISVYDSAGELVGTIGEDSVWYDDSKIFIEKYGDTKSIYSVDKGLRFEIEGTDYGELNCYFEEYVDGNPVGRVNYYEIPLEAGTDISVQVDGTAPELTADSVEMIVDSDSVSPSDSFASSEYDAQTVSVTYGLSIDDAGQLYGSGNYVQGDAVTVLAEAKDGYDFLGWQDENGSLLSVSPVHSFTARENIILTALFAETENEINDPVYSVEVVNGTASESSYVENATVHIYADPAQQGKIFDKWTTSSSGVRFANKNAANTSFVMPAHKVTVTATYKDKGTQQPDTAYTVTVIGGTGGGNYEEGDTVAITANTAPSDKVFDRWTTSSSGVSFANKNAASTSFVMPAHEVTVTAAYKDKDTPTKPGTAYTVTVVNGTGSGDCEEGETITITANTAPTGRVFDKWTSSSKEVFFANAFSERTSFVMPAADVTVTATYRSLDGNSSSDGNSGGNSSSDGGNSGSSNGSNVSGGSGSKPSIKPNTVTPAPVPSTPSTRFTDVSSDAYYCDAVMWGVENGIISGMGGKKFKPNDPCTRAQVVTFLWRAAGSPTSEANIRFKDVPEDSYYHDAVQWAVSQGIAKGMGKKTFNPNMSCTRSQALTFLCRANGSPNEGDNIRFVDVDPDAYYASAVQWAVSNKIAKGMGAKRFGPDTPCTRAQIVTFLYRDKEK